MPAISVVIPTRNRPEFVRSALESLRCQTFGDFEVLIVDNHTGVPCRHVVDEIGDGRFRYLTPDVPIPMHENWELGVTHASGAYVAVLIDKTVLKPRALQVLAECANRFDADLVSWPTDSYSVEAPSRGVCYRWAEPPTEPALFDGHDEIRRRFTLDVRRGAEGRKYFWGKICFGAYRRDLITRIRSTAGRVFFPITPDYTSMLSALALARTPVDAGQACIIQCLSDVSNGWNVAHKPEYAREFLAGIDPSGKIIEALPIPGLFTSVHNLVCYDYLSMQRRLADHFPGVQVDVSNLLKRVAEDLYDVHWAGSGLKDAHYGVLEHHLAQLRPDQKAAHRRAVRRYMVERIQFQMQRLVRRSVTRMPMGESALQILRPLVRALGGRDHSGAPPPRYFDSVLSAAAASDTPKTLRSAAR